MEHLFDERLLYMIAIIVFVEINFVYHFIKILYIHTIQYMILLNTFVNYNYNYTKLKIKLI